MFFSKKKPAPAQIADPQQEEKRLSALYRYGILDTPAEEAFDCITRIAKNALDVPIALVTLIDRDRQWFKSRQGVRLDETPRDISFCSRTIEGNRALNIPNLRKDTVFAGNPLVRGFPFLRFYCGVPLRTKDGYNIGALCVLGYRPRNLKPGELALLGDLARLTIDEIELRGITDADYLTGLPTHRVFIQAGKDAMRAPQLGILLFTIDKYKDMARDYGSAVTEMLTQAVATACQSLFAPKNCFAHVGGGRFAVLVEGSETEMHHLISKISAVIDALPAQGPNNDIRLECRFGTAVKGMNDNDFRLIYNRAEIALVQGKMMPKKEMKLEEMQASYALGTDLL